jgi:hypothetical protein
VTDILTSEVTKLDAILLKLDRIDALLTEFEPVLRAYLDPAASGPVAWAVRKRLGVNNGKS